MKKCPYCWESIQNTAKKCRFCWEWLNEPKINTKSKTNIKSKLITGSKSKGALIITRDDLNEEQKEIIRKTTRTNRIIWIFLPWIFILWARSYWIFALFIIINVVIGLLWEDVWGVLALLWLIGSRIWLYNEWSKRAFNNSKWYLIWLVNKK